MNEPSPEALEQLRVLVYQEFDSFKNAVASRIAPAVSWMNVKHHNQDPALLAVILTMVRPNVRFPGRGDELRLQFMVRRNQPGYPIEIIFATAEGDVLSTAPPVALSDVVQDSQTVSPAYQERLRAYLMAQVDPTCRFLLDTPVGDAAAAKRKAEYGEL